MSSASAQSLSHVWLFATPWTVACRLLSLWNSPGKNTGTGCHFLLQGIFPIQRSNPGLLYLRQILYHLSHQGSPPSMWIVRNTQYMGRQEIENFFFFSVFKNRFLEKWLRVLVSSKGNTRVSLCVSLSVSPLLSVVEEVRGLPYLMSFVGFPSLLMWVLALHHRRSGQPLWSAPVSFEHETITLW